MRLAPGTRLGPYTVAAPLGAGGMGEVYRAHDATLNRDVAIKVLLSSVAADPDRLARFTREAQLLAALNHPHIAQVYGFEDADGVRALVMELVEGPTLAERMARGPIPVDEVLPTAHQIAEALEAAHEAGIIHRDLKPANIKVRPDGTVKVLDLGLAKALEPSGVASADATISPTTMSQLSEAGVILGTAAYMAPEQARGRVVDRRADIWAFGCVLYEMLTGQRAFPGADVTDTIVAVLSREPDWAALPAAAAPLRPLVARCLKKDPRQRTQAMGDVRVQLDELLNPASDPAVARVKATEPASPLRFAAVAAALVATAAVAAFATWLQMQPAPQVSPEPARFEIVPPGTQPLTLFSTDRDVAISPDGRHVAYRSGGAVGQLVVRRIDSLDVRVVDGITGVRAPFFSPDGQWIGFFDGAGLKRVAITGGPAITIVSGYMVPRGASWGDDGRIVFGTYDPSTGLLRVPTGGGEPQVLTRPDEESGPDHWYPSTLPGGRGVLLTVNTPMAGEAQVAVLDLETGRVKPLMRGGQPEYVDTGHLLYARADALYAVRFDPARLEVVGDPVPLVEGVSMSHLSGAADFAVSRQGTLVYVPAGAAQGPRSLVWIDRQGRETPTGAANRNYTGVRLSPDGTRVALAIEDQQSDIYLWQLARETLTPLTFGPGNKQHPVWTANGRRLVFTSQDGLTSQAADGTGAVERLVVPGMIEPSPAYVAPDGSGILGAEFSPVTSGDIVWFPLPGPIGPGLAPDARPEPADLLVATTFNEMFPEVSPDGRYLAYQSNESGQDEIYVRPFPRVNDGLWRVSARGGTHPKWAGSGRELFYRDLANVLTAVPVEIAGSTFSHGNPSALFEMAYVLPGSPPDYDPAPDGQRFLVIRPQGNDSGAPAPATFVVVLNWFEELKAKLPAGR